MSEEYREVAKKLGVKYLFGRWGVQFMSNLPDGGREIRPRLIKLNGWIFDPHEIKQALVDDGWSINVKPEKEG